jgi:hypothetical protein
VAEVLTHDSEWSCTLGGKVLRSHFEYPSVLAMKIPITDGAINHLNPGDAVRVGDDMKG